MYAAVAMFSIPKATEALREKLAIPKPAPPLRPTPRDPNWSSGVLSPADLAAAEAAYRRRFAEALKRPPSHGR